MRTFVFGKDAYASSFLTSVTATGSYISANDL